MQILLILMQEKDGKINAGFEKSRKSVKRSVNNMVRAVTILFPLSVN